MKSILIDINSFAINLVEDHPGYSYIEPIISSALTGQNSIKVLDIVPYRAFWILTKKWKIEKKDAKTVIENFINAFPQIDYFGLDRNSLILSFEFSSKLNHDIYDCYYLAGAITRKCESILTTDSDFEFLCKKLNNSYSFNLN